MCKYNRGREGVKTVKTLSRCIMSSRPDVMQLLFFSLSSEKHRLTMERRSVRKFCYVVCLHVCIAFPLGPFFLQFRNTDVRVYHRYTLNRLQTATVRRRELTNYYKQPTAPGDSTATQPQAALCPQ